MSDQLSPEHLSYFRRVFLQFDADGNNVMTKQELRLLMGALGENLSQAKIDELISQIDRDGNGTVDCEEFLHLMHIIMKRADPEAECRRAFRIFDRDGNGAISSSEMRQVMVNLERPLTESQIEEIYKEVGLTGKEEIDQEEFVRLLMQREGGSYNWNN